MKKNESSKTDDDTGAITSGADDHATTRAVEPARRLRAGVRAGTLVGPDDEEPVHRSPVEQWWV